MNNQKQNHLTPQQIIQVKKMEAIKEEFQAKLKTTIDSIQSNPWAGTFSDVTIRYKAKAKLNGGFILERVSLQKPEYLTAAGLGQEEYDRILGNAIDIIRESISDAISARTSEVFGWLNEQIQKLSGGNTNFNDAKDEVLKEIIGENKEEVAA